MSSVGLCVTRKPLPNRSTFGRGGVLRSLFPICPRFHFSVILLLSSFVFSSIFFSSLVVHSQSASARGRTSSIGEGLVLKNCFLVGTILFSRFWDFGADFFFNCLFTSLSPSADLPRELWLPAEDGAQLGQSARRRGAHPSHQADAEVRRPAADRPAGPADAGEDDRPSLWPAGRDQAGKEDGQENGQLDTTGKAIRPLRAQVAEDAHHLVVSAPAPPLND